MSDRLPTVKALLADENLLRRAAGEVLKPGPWKHEWAGWGVGTCLKCHTPIFSSKGVRLEVFKQPCPVPDPVEGPLDVVASRLGKKCAEQEDDIIYLNAMVYRYLREIRHPKRNECSICPWWFAYLATPAERIVCCLLALGKARNDEQEAKP